MRIGDLLKIFGWWIFAFGAILFAFSRVMRWAMRTDPSIRPVATYRTDRYILGDVRRGQATIRSFLTCRKCGRTTYSPEDVLYKYCDRCQQWLDMPDHGGIR